MSEFLSTYSSAFAKKPKTIGTGDIGASNFKIYLLLLIFWRGFERLKSVHQLHEVFTKILGTYQTGNLKRMEKICERIGLHLGKPGRPQKRQ